MTPMASSELLLERMSDRPERTSSLVEPIPERTRTSSPMSIEYRGRESPHSESIPIPGSVPANHWYHNQEDQVSFLVPSIA